MNLSFLFDLSAEGFLPDILIKEHKRQLSSRGKLDPFDYFKEEIGPRAGAIRLMTELTSATKTTGAPTNLKTVAMCVEIKDIFLLIVPERINVRM